MSEVKFIEIKDIDDGMRLNRWFLKYYPDLPMSRLQKLLRTKQIKVDNKRAEVGLKLVAGQTVRVPPLTQTTAQENYERTVSKKDAEYIQSMVIYKDENIIVLNKPSGIAVQGGTNTKHHIDGLLEGLKYEMDEKPKLVHRIDKDTSGILVLARNRKMAEKLTKAFKEQSIAKNYLALVYGCPNNMSGEVNAALEKVGDKSIVSDEGKKAITKYEVLDCVGKKYALVDASPVTGRTHQIRVHMEYIGCPIVGDGKYYGEEKQETEVFSRKLHLHAYKIDLSSIYNIKTIIKAQIPDYFKSDLSAVGIDFKG